ncbi:MAG: type II toxin-antitoxin system RelE/ParE family toxin [Proteobacteria bacterium]|nr:type II toxin-antitoxin system RelE/ParE family toxin [Pseudomonadota bacterium]
MRIVWADSARRDFDNAISFLEERSRAGADRIGERILRVIALLEEFPRLAPASRHRGLRQLVVPRTPYIVIYRVEAGQVEIRAVVHARQKRRK